MSLLIEFKQFSLQLQQQQVVKSINLALHKGQITALVGESGSGKSVTALSLCRLLEGNLNVEYAGQINHYIGDQQRDILQLSSRALRQFRSQDVGFVFQDALMSLNPLHNIEKQLLEAINDFSLSHNEKRHQVEHWLSKVGIKQAKQRLKDFPHQFSGGEQQRIMIAMALIKQPSLLIADEATTALDVSVQKQILDLLLQLKQELNLTILFISHDLNVVNYLADSIAVMLQGELVEQGSKTQIMQHSQHPYTQSLLNSQLTACSNKNLSQQTLLTTQQFKVFYPIKQGILQRVRGYNKAVNAVNLQLKQGSCTALIGESGSGKSSLARALLALEAYSGDYQFLGQSVSFNDKKLWRKLRKQKQMVFQDPFSSLSPRMIIADILAEPLIINEIGDRQSQQQQVQQAMLDVGLSVDMLQRYPHEFSGGQRQRIAIARAIILKPKLIILDEPTSSLDRSIQLQVLNLLQQLQQQYNLTYLFISHDLHLVRHFCDYFLVMQSGHIVEQGDAQQIFEQAQQPYTQTLLSAML